MSEITDSEPAAVAASLSRASIRLTPLVLAAALIAVIGYGGYGQHWGWLGINGHTATLWDWLHLLLLPIVAIMLSIWFEHRPALGRTSATAAATLAVAFFGVVLAGYAIPWTWTGFTGNRLWDWMNLGALPFAVVLIPVLPELRERWERRHSIVCLVVGGVLAVLVLGGYLADWGWTGFAGNTIWDWLHLLLLPLLVPIVIAPTIKSPATAWLGPGPEPDSADPAPDADTASTTHVVRRESVRTAGKPAGQR